MTSTKRQGNEHSPNSSVTRPAACCYSSATRSAGCCYSFATRSVEVPLLVRYSFGGSLLLVRYSFGGGASTRPLLVRGGCSCHGAVLVLVRALAPGCSSGPCARVMCGARASYVLVGRARTSSSGVRCRAPSGVRASQRPYAHGLLSLFRLLSAILLHAIERNRA